MTDPLADLRFGVIGTGRVAQALMQALKNQGTRPPRLWGRNADNVSETIKAVAGAIAAPTAVSLIQQCNIVAIAVSDDALPQITDMLASATYDHAPLIFHVSGRSGASVLTPLERQGARIAAIHPAMTFTGNPVAEAARMVGAPFAVTASSAEARDAAFAWVTGLGGTPFHVAEDKRALYHAALSHAANHLVTLLSGAADMLRAAGVESPYQALRPLAAAALSNVLDRGFDALSGPILRGDAGTIASHIAALEQSAPAMLPPYHAMAQATLAALHQNGVDHPAIKALLDAQDKAG